jgi:hypothetical protein
MIPPFWWFKGFYTLTLQLRQSTCSSKPPGISTFSGEEAPLSGVCGSKSARDRGSVAKRNGDGSKPWYLVNPKIAGKWMFIPLKMYL